ncbi:MAG TPA: xanthine dehydrogenase family protein subunit M [Stellaceae bacterium]|jgi:CO/xanthine dehydrogenase FAD-binding subunit|nr:xanthine dehydrogenase family protein subunit M [Stellaceae bacterium]
MKAVDFDYACPGEVGEACRLLATAGGDGKIIAGGQTLVPLLAMRLARPALLIDINRISELQGIEPSGDAVVVRACTRQSVALADATIRQRVPLLAKALGFVGHVQTRNRGTIGGSLANADPSAEIGLAARALDAEIEARSAAGRRTIPIADFFMAPMMTALEPEECLTAVRFPIWPGPGRIGTGFQEVSARRSDFAVAAVAVQLQLDGKGVCRRIALSIGGAGPKPVSVEPAAARLAGTRLAGEDLAEAARIVREAIEPENDLHASADYRRRLVGALVERAVAEAARDALAARE